MNKLFRFERSLTLRTASATRVATGYHYLFSILIASGIFARAFPLFAGTEQDFFQGSDLNVAGNYNPPGLPSNSSDVLLTTPLTALHFDAVSLQMGSLNLTANSVAYTISNNTATGTGSFIDFAPLMGGGNSISGQAADAIYVGGMNSTLTIQGANGGTGSGGLSFGSNTSFSLDVAQASSTLNISAMMIFGSGGGITKTGAGVLNLTAPISVGGGSGSLIINQGTTNLLSGFTAGGNINLTVSNSMAAPASDVTINVQTSVQFRSLSGSVASPSAHATINLQGAGTQLNLFQAGGTFGGSITGTGSVAVVPALGSSQTFSGNNTYTGTTTVGGGVLRINGTTSGQGNFTVGSFGGTLTGSGTIGLATNGTITINNFGRLTAGADNTTGALHVTTSGTGGVIMGAQSTFLVDIGAAGANDLLAIAGGYIDLTSASDTLSLNNLGIGFDGSSYTIATFAQNLGSGIFNTVTGLPANYIVAYHPTDIMLLPIPEPASLYFGAESLVLLGCAGARRWRRR